TVVAREAPVEQGGADQADVRRSGRRRAEANANVAAGGRCGAGIRCRRHHRRFYAEGALPIREDAPKGPAYAASRAMLRRIPMPGTSTSTESPPTNAPTPAGVPVRITSPGSSVNAAVTYSMIVGMSKIMSVNEPRWTSASLWRVRISPFETSNSATFAGPGGQKVAHRLVRAPM